MAVQGPCLVYSSAGHTASDRHCFKLNGTRAGMSMEGHRKESGIKDAPEKSKEEGGDGYDTHREFQEAQGSRV